MIFNTPKKATLVRAGRALVIAVGLAVAAQAGPVYLEASVEGREGRPALVLTGRQATLVMALTSAVAEQPELAGDLFATAGSLAAPLFANRTLPLSRIGTPAAGLQRFRFSIDIPAAERKQQLLLRLRVRNDPAGAWLPLPPVVLEARPAAWQAALQRFTRQYPAGRLPGSERLEKVFQSASAETAEIFTEGTAVRVGFADASAEPQTLPESPGILWIVFKPAAVVDLDISRPAPDGPLVLTLDARILGHLETDAVAQDVFERALATAHALLASSDSSPTTP